MKHLGVLVAVGLLLAVVAVLLYLNDPEPQPIAESGASGQIESDGAASQPAADGSSQSDSTEEPESSEESVAGDAASAESDPEQAPQQAPDDQSAASDIPADAPEASDGASDGAGVASGETAAAPAQTTEPTQPAQPGVERVAPSFDIVRVEKDGSTLIAGRGTPGAEVEVMTAPGETFASATADRRGEFVALPDAPLAPGKYELRLRSRPDADSDWLASEQSVLVVVPRPRAVAENDGGDAAAPASPMTVLLSDDPNEVSRVLQAPEGLGLTSGDLALEIIDYDDAGNLVIAGTAPSESRLFVYLNDLPVSDTKADGAGRWNALPAEPVAAGEHRLRVDQIGDDGKVVARIEARFYRAEGDPQMASGAVTVEPGNSLWRIARRTYGRGIRYTLIYQANKDQIRDPDLIYPGQIFILPEAPGATD